MWLGSIVKIFTLVHSIFGLAMEAFRHLKEWQIKKANDELKKSVEKATVTGDQRDLEKAIGSSNAGKPTKHKIDGLEKEEL